MVEDGSISEVAPAGPAKRLIHRLFAIGENRLNLLVAEVEEEREYMLGAVCLIIGVVALGLLAGMAFTAALVIALWQSGPVLVLCILGSIFGIAALVFWRRFTAVRHRQIALSATLDQIRKDLELFRNSDEL